MMIMKKKVSVATFDDVIVDFSISMKIVEVN